VRRVLFVQPSLDPPGGGNLVAAWMLQALREDHDVTVLACESPSLAELNRWYGTALAADDFRLVLASLPVRALGRVTPTPMSLVRNMLLMREARRRRPGYDLVVTCNNEGDLGDGPAVQYVHFPMLWLGRPETDLHWYNRQPAVIRAYYRLSVRSTGYSVDRMVRHTTLANSAFIAERIRTLHGIAPTVLHPPIVGVFPDVPWEARANGVVAIGRLSPEKRFEEIVAILAAVRRAHPDVTLHVVGSTDRRAYGRRMRALFAAHADWVRLHLDVSRDQLLALVSRQRYGIHAMPDEHFGIAVAEMLSAGCLPFVPDTGGAAEIVGDAPALRFGSPAEAAARIDAVLRDAGAQDALRRHCAARAELFTRARFVAGFRAAVDQAAGSAATSRRNASLSR
jgi:glycosyltransferase involved in cell wall biosynthesis